jgi:DNA polymerase-3 subunit beta
VIIPSKAVEELGRILEDNQKDVELHFSPSSILFKYDGTLLLSRLLEGNYPETSKLIPLEFPNEVVFNKEQLLIAIERASLLSIRDGQNAIVKLEIKEDDTVEISSSSPEIGRVLEEIQPVAEVKGNPLKIAFSSKFLLDALKAFNSSEIKVGFTGEIRPFVMTGEYDPDMLQLILPVKTD